MKNRTSWYAGFCVVAAFSTVASTLNGACLPDGTQPSGAKYRICLPDPGRYNGKLVMYAHGYMAFNEPVGIPEDQLTLPDGTSLPTLLNGLGYAFAVTGYRVTGLAVVPAIQDLSELVTIFKTTVGVPTKIYLAGPSEGGLISALAIERTPQLYNAGLAACGPVGSFSGQINYIGDFRVVFDYFFPGVIPGSPVNIPANVIQDWDSIYVPAIKTAIAAYPAKAKQVLNVTGAPVGLDPATIEQTFENLLWYNVFTANDAVAKLGGQPYSNRGRIFSGSTNDAALNIGVSRFDADPVALLNITLGYQTTGKISKNLVTIHTLGDPIIPYWQEPVYRQRIEAQQNGALHSNIPVLRYGHCNIKAGEILVAFGLMVLKESGERLPDGAELLLPPDQREAFSQQMRFLGLTR